MMERKVESDINPVFRCLADNYMDVEAPELQLAFFDIEVDFNKDLGFANPEDPFNAVTAIAVHLSWLKRTVCLTIKPKTLTKEAASTAMRARTASFLLTTILAFPILFYASSANIFPTHLDQ